MKHRAYPAYKPSGMEWVGDIPEHWEVRRMKTVARFGYGDSLAADDRVAGPYKVYGSNGVVDQHDRANTQSPCLIIGRKGSFGKVAFSDKPCFAIDTTYFVDSRLTAANLRWLYYSLQWLRLDSISKDSAVPGLSREDAYDNRIAFCPLDEQQTIASFLDRETARIDTLIEKKQRQIELLQEKRSALISHAVTKGLDPDVKMRDSGIEWLGEIPAHWEEIRFKYVLWLQRGHDLPGTEFHEGKYPVCGSNGCIGYHNQFTTKGPGITVGRSGSVGEVNYIDTDYWAHNTALYVKEFRKAIPRFSYYLLKTLDVKYLSAGTAVGPLNRNYIHDLPIAIPVIKEQSIIAGFLDQQTERIDALIGKVEKSINLLREHRTSLISAAVTGKIDVRTVPAGRQEEAPNAR